MSAEATGFRRFLHWGPIMALSIIKCITLTTLYMNSMWWPPNESLGGFINQACFVVFSTMVTFFYVMSTLTGPGLLPKQWLPKNLKDVNQLQFCKVCKGYKAPRSHHCRKCNRCVKKMDHHCPWINHCVGWANHAYFCYFLGSAIGTSFYSSVILCCAFYRGLYRYWYLTHGQLHLATVNFTLFSIIMCIFAMGLAIGVVIALSMLLFFQFKSILKNQTGIEIWIVEKANYRRKHNPDMYEFVYPYDLGGMENMRQVFNSDNVKQGDGIEWPVRENCDQYTFTREQIGQKAEKRVRTKTFKCIRPSTGRLLPLFSQGFRVCLAPPCTDEPRIRLEPDDIIKVTRFRQHWLFGERVVASDDASDAAAATNDQQPTAKQQRKKQNKRTGAIRGWFPRRCAIELIEPDQFENSDSEAEATTAEAAPETVIAEETPSEIKQRTHLNGKAQRQQNGQKKKKH